jgi:AraC-like DNA-binding protein
MKASLLVDAPILDKKQIWVKKVNKPFFDHDFHFHKTEEICWIEEGCGNMIVGDFLGQFEKNDFLIFGMGLPHILRCNNTFHRPNPKKNTIAHSIYFTESHIRSLTDDPSMLHEIKQYLNKAERGYRLNGKQKAKAIELLKKVINSSRFEQLGHFLHLLEYLHSCKKSLPLASSNYQLHPSETDMKRFTEVYDYLLKNFQQHISLTKVAAICSMTTNAFCRFFKSKTQKTFVQFLTEIRIGYACTQLQNENLPIKNLCYDCGFNNPVLFHRAFKKITGKTPKHFRESITVLH